MTAKEYLQQAYRLDNRINANLAEISRLRELTKSISSPDFGEHFNPNHTTEAPFICSLERIWELERKIDAEIDLLVELKGQIRDLIEKVPNTDEQMVLRYRYIHNMTWDQIGQEMYSDERTVRRWHRQALSHLVLPEQPIIII